MSFEIKYYSPGGLHITLDHDGSIEIFTNEIKTEDGAVVIDYLQAKILKAMILAEAELEKTEK